MTEEPGLAALAAAELGADDAAAALPFLEAAAAQLGAPLAVGGRERSPARERAAARRAARVLRLAAADPDAAAALLADDPPLLAVFFGNADLLFQAGYRGADAVGTATVHAAWLLEGRGPE